MSQLDLFAQPTAKPKKTKKDQFDLIKWAKEWQPKKKFIDIPLEEVKKRTPHGWMLKYLYGVDAMTNKRWLFWMKANQIRTHYLFHYTSKGLTDEFLDNCLYCHEYPLINFSENKNTLEYIYSCIGLLTNNGESLQNATNYFLDWLLYGFGHENFKDRPQLNSRTNVESKLYQYVDLFPLLYYPADYFNPIMAEIFPVKQNQQKGFFPTPITVCTLMAKLIKGSFQLNVETMNEPCCGTGSQILAYSNTGGMCVNAVELQELVIKACLVNLYFYCPMYARPIWYLADKNSLVWGNSLTVECFTDYHAEYKKLVQNN